MPGAQHGCVVLCVCVYVCMCSVCDGSQFCVGFNPSLCRCGGINVGSLQKFYLVLHYINNYLC